MPRPHSINEPGLKRANRERVVRIFGRRVVVIYSDTLEKHERRLRNFFSRLREHNFTLQTDKAEFLKGEVTYLGHIISANVVSPKESEISQTIFGPSELLPAIHPGYGKMSQPANRFDKHQNVIFLDGETSKKLRRPETSSLRRTCLTIP